MVRLTDNEIIKAFECCSTASCISKQCPYEKMHDIPKCTTKLTKDALDLINRQKAEIESEKKRADMWHREAELNAAELIKMQAEIEDLKKDINHYKINLPYLEHQSEDFCGVPCSFMENLVEKAKAEAIKECLDKFDIEYCKMFSIPEIEFMKAFKRRFLKEMVGEE